MVQELQLVLLLMMEMERSSGHVRIYDYNGSAWVQVGGDIDGEAQAR